MADEPRPRPKTYVYHRLCFETHMGQFEFQVPEGWEIVDQRLMEPRTKGNAPPLHMVLRRLKPA